MLHKDLFRLGWTLKFNCPFSANNTHDIVVSEIPGKEYDSSKGISAANFLEKRQLFLIC